MRLRVWLCALGLFLLSGSSEFRPGFREEDRVPSSSPQKPIPPFGLILLPSGQKCANPDRRLAPELAEELKSLFRELAPEATINSDEEKFKVEFQCQTYRSHRSRGKSGTQSPISYDVIGPSNCGFQLDLAYREARDSYGPQTFAGESREEYWNTRRIVVTLPKDRGWVYLTYSYGNQTDRKLLDGIQAAIEKVYDFEFAPGQFGLRAQTRRCRVDEILEELEEPLCELIQKRYPTATVTLLEHQLTVSHRVQTFTVHAVDSHGQVSSEPHKEAGPVEDGFLIQVCGTRRSVQAQEASIYGKIHGPYWTRIWNCIEANRPGSRTFYPYDRIRIDVSYGLRADKQLFRDLEELMDQYGELAIRGQFAK